MRVYSNRSFILAASCGFVVGLDEILRLRNPTKKQDGGKDSGGYSVPPSSKPHHEELGTENPPDVPAADSGPVKSVKAQLQAASEPAVLSDITGTTKRFWAKRLGHTSCYSRTNKTNEAFQPFYAAA